MIQVIGKALLKQVGINMAKLKEWMAPKKNNSKLKEWTPEEHDWEDQGNQENNQGESEDIYAENAGENINKGLGAFPLDVAKSITGMPLYAANMISALPGELEGAYHEPLGRSLKNIGKGTLDFAKFAANPAGPGMKYLAEKEIPYISALAKKWPQWPKEDIFNLGEQQPGDVTWQSATPFGLAGRAVKGLSGLKGLTSRAAVPASAALSQGENPLQAALMGTALEGLVRAPGAINRNVSKAKEIAADLSKKDIKDLNQQIEKAKSKIELSKTKEEEAKLNESEVKENAHAETGKSGKGALSYAINEALKKRNELASKLEAPENLNIEKPIIQEVPEAHNFIKKTEGATTNLKTHEQKLAEKEAEIKEHLGEGQTHHERYAHEVAKETAKIENENNANYSNVDKGLSSENVVISNKENQRPLLEKIHESLSKNKTEEGEVAAESLEPLLKEENIKAKDYLHAYRKIRNAGHEQSMLAKEHYGTEAGDKAYNAAKELKSQSEAMYSIIKKSIPDELFEKLEKAQEYFRDTVAPWRGNTLSRQIKKKVKVSGNLMEHGIGNESGQHVLHKMLETNPEMRRLAVGQKFAKKPGELHNPNEELKNRYLPKMPELRKLMQEHKLLLDEHPILKFEHQEAIEFDKNQQKIADKKGKARENAINANENSMNEYHKKVEKELNKAKSEIPILDDKINSYKKHLEIIKEESKKTKNTIKERMNYANETVKLNAKLKEAEAKRDKALGSVKQIIKFISKIKGLNMIGNSAARHMH